MSVKLEKESIRLCEAVCLPYCQVSAEGDVIVPDVKPDIQKILQVEPCIRISQKNVQSDKVYVAGEVKVNILYLPERCEDGAVKAISASLEFSHLIDAKGAKPGAEVCLDAECLATEFALLNSRKLNVRAKIGLSARLLGIKEMEIATGASWDDEIEVKKSSMKIYNPKIDAVREVRLLERLEVPPGGPSICEVLKVSAKKCAAEVSLGENFALVKGEVKICALYCPEGEVRAPETIEETRAFEERFEIDGVLGDMHGEVEFLVRDVLFEVSEDADGDRRILACDVCLDANVRTFEIFERLAVEDAYGKGVPIEIEKEEYRIEEMLATETAQTTIKETVLVPEYLPGIHKLCEYTAVPLIESVELCEKEARVKGYITVNFLYLSKDEKEPVLGFSHNLPFEHSFEIDGICPDAVCDARAEVEHIGCTISTDKAFEVRAIILIGIKAVRPRSVELVSKINYCEDTECAKRPSMAVYFVKQGDTLWDIAKKYRVAQDAITSLNGSEEEIMVPGKCIYICK